MEKSDKSVQFLSIVQNNKGIIYKVANLYCKNEEDRKDLVQEIIIQLWKSFDKYDDQYKYSTWIYRIALNVSISFYRKSNSRQKISHPLTEELISIPTNENIDDKETDLGILQQFISQLKDLDKALMLLYLEERSYSEISQIMGISESNVSTKVNRIKNSLKQKFSQLKSQ